MIDQDLSDSPSRKVFFILPKSRDAMTLPAPQLPARKMRALGYHRIDLLVAHVLALQACDALQRKLAEDLTKDGFALINTTSVRGQTVVRTCPINPLTPEKNLGAMIAKLHELACRHETNLARLSL